MEFEERLAALAAKVQNQRCAIQVAEGARRSGCAHESRRDSLGLVLA